jgi:hypothetical protein
VFVDLSKSFDSIVHDKLWNRLTNIALSDKFIISIYKNVRAKERTAFGKS